MLKRFRGTKSKMKKPMDTRNFKKTKKHTYTEILSFLKDITVSFYKHQMNGFKECLDDVMPNKSIDGIFEFIEGGIVDGTEINYLCSIQHVIIFFAQTYVSFNPLKTP